MNGYKIFIDTNFEKLEFDDPEIHRDPNHIKVYKLALSYLITLICFQVGPWLETTENIWQSIGISDLDDRVAYAIEHWEKILYKGPLYSMALMAFSQSGQKYSRGAFNDSLHTIYLSYSDLLFSADTHFSQLSSMLSGTLYARRVQNIESTMIKEGEDGVGNFSRIVT